MPCSIGDSTTRSSGLEQPALIRQTTLLESSDASCNNRGHISVGNWPDHAKRSGKGGQEIIVHEPDRQSSCAGFSLSAPLAQEVPFASYSGQQSGKESVGEYVNGRPYPSLIEAVRNDHLATVSVPHSVGQLSRKIANGSANRATVTDLETAVTNCSGPRTGDLSVPSTVIKTLQGDPLSEVVDESLPLSRGKGPAPFASLQDIGNERVTQISSQCRSKTYPCLAQAAKSIPPAYCTARQSIEHPSIVNASIRPYPHLFQAVKDDPVPSLPESDSTVLGHDELGPLEHILLSCKKLGKIRRLSSPLRSNLEESFELQEEVIQHILFSCRQSGDPSKEYPANAAGVSGHRPFF